ncbi:MAG: hypothetical protein C0399_06365 [Syntrophus sp. (in: bacteria)]|nr:hypothetical protein [Syntrophus sp. (in: bacteria)]
MIKHWIYIAVFCLLCSCAHIEEAKETKIPVNPPDILSPVSFQIEKEKPVGATKDEECFSFSLREADIKDILRAIGKQANYNIVVEPDVKGVTTVDLINVTLGKALEYILEPLDFTYKIEDHTIYVSKPKLETRIFHVNYIALKKIGTSNVQATPGTTGGTAASGGLGSQVSVKSETESDLWKSLEENIKTLLSKGEAAKYAVNKHTMMIFVTDYPKSLKDIEMFLKAAEGVIQRQVMIETKIMEVQLNDNSRQGINWKLVNAQVNGIALSGQQAFLNPLSDPSGSIAIATTPFFRVSAGSKYLDRNNTFIDLLGIYGKVETISNPKIATMNNQRAIIKVTTQDVYFESEMSTATTTPIVTAKAKFIDVGLTLDVMPQIDDKGNIILNVHPIMSEKIDDAASPATGGGSVPILNVREVDTIVKVREGETIVIGGLIKNKKSTTDTGTKGLMSIPIIGHLFKLNEKESSKSELVILLTPRIIYGDNN